MKFVVAFEYKFAHAIKLLARIKLLQQIICISVVLMVDFFVFMPEKNVGQTAYIPVTGF